LSSVSARIRKNDSKYNENKDIQLGKKSHQMIHEKITKFLKKGAKTLKKVAKRFKIPYLKNQRFAETKKKCEQTDLIKKS